MLIKLVLVFFSPESLGLVSSEYHWLKRLTIFIPNKNTVPTITIAKAKHFQRTKHTIFKETDPWKLKIEAYLADKKIKILKCQEKH